ncbi:MAG: cell wall hydrolase [Fibrobacter sp.]|nr:cell wall hydrolase [Fibrobacter sp.]
MKRIAKLLLIAVAVSVAWFSDYASLAVYEPLDELEEEAFFDELEVLALITLAEAEGEVNKNLDDPYLGWRLVIDTVLNRVDSPRFPDTISEVVYQKGQFTSTWNGRMDRMELNEDICRIVLEEIENRTNSDVLFFCSTGWPQCGKHECHVGHHYFTK